MDHIYDIFSDIPITKEAEEMNERDLLMVKLLNANDYLLNNNNRVEEAEEILQNIALTEVNNEIK